MFVAPGCDGCAARWPWLLALIVGYLKHMRPMPWTLFVGEPCCCLRIQPAAPVRGNPLLLAGAADTGHQRSGTEVDYAIGGVLFFCAALFLFGIPRLLQPQVRS